MTEWSDRVETCEERFSTERNDKIRRQILQHVTMMPVLEAGCGTQEMSKFVDEYVGLDITSEFEPDIVGDVTDMPFDDGEFPTVITKNVIQHVEDWQTAIDECARVAEHRVVHAERTHDEQTQIVDTDPVLRRRFNPTDIWEHMHGDITVHDCRADHRLTLFVGVL